MKNVAYDSNSFADPTTAVGQSGAGQDAVESRSSVPEELRLQLVSTKSQVKSAQEQLSSMSGELEWYWRTDENNRFTYMSHNVQAHTGNSQSWFVGKTRAEVIADYYDAASISEITNPEFDREAYDVYHEAIEQQQPFSNYVYRRRKEGEIRWQSISGVPIFSSGEDKIFLGYFGVAKDITALREQIHKQGHIGQAIDSLSTGFAVYDQYDQMIYCNPAFIRQLSIPADVPLADSTLEDGLRLAGRASGIRYTEGSEDEWLAAMMLAFQQPKSSGEWRDGRSNWLRYDSERTTNGRLLVEVRSINEQKNAERALSQEKNLLRSLICSIPDAIYAVDREHKYVVANTATARLYGLEDPADLIGNTMLDCLPGRDDSQILNEEKNILETGEPIDNREIRFFDKYAKQKRTVSLSKVPLKDPQNNIVGIVGHTKDITSLAKLTDQLSYQAEHDVLTGLINRRGFDQRVNAALMAYRKSQSVSTIGFIDLDQFKVVNDTAGHKAGDQLLQKIADQFKRHINDDITIARLGGDEFGFIVHDTSIDDATAFVEKLLAEVSDIRFLWDNMWFEVGFSAGLVEINATDQSVDSLLSQADVACYMAKDLGRGRCHIYSRSDELCLDRHRELACVAKIRTAIDEDRFVLYQQPIATAASTELDIHHVEVLIRMVDANGEHVSPGVFIPAAERFQLMPAIDRWVINEVTSRFEDIVGQCRNTVVSINISGNSLSDADLVEYIKNKISDCAVEPSRFCFEITESAFIRNIANAQSLVQELSELGCSFALDDFGTGLSSFSYLKNFTIDYLKIDGSFVRNIIDDDTDKAMVIAINNIGHTLGIATVAEFVETDQHVAALQEIGVDYLQGYAIGKPAVVEPLAPLTDAE